jgi:signal transduction histidine kinase
MREVRAGATQSVEGRHPTEVQPLVNELNSMIKGQRDSLQRARAQAGNLAHALKTPLAIVTDEAFLLGQRGESAAAHTIADQCKAMQVHIDHHIARARAQAVSRMPGLRSSVSQNIAGIVSALGRLHVQSGIEIEQTVDVSLHAAMDEQDLSELVANLIDNAYKFARSRIAVTATALGSESLLISIEDDGPGLPPEARDRVFAPGVRLDETRPGTGLGLSIVRDLIELYEGKIELSASSLGGLAARVTLPRQA